MNFTNDQLTAYAGMSNFISGNLDMMYLVDGSAGTGKTSVISQFISDLPRHMKVCAAAPTHKAIGVIQDKCRDCKRPITYWTVHRLLGLSAGFGENGEMVFDGNEDKPYTHAFDIIFIDEASMLSHTMFRFLTKYSMDTNALIIFIGDSFQLPPIGEQMSEVFSIRDTTRLQTVVRAKSDVLMDAFSRFRNYVATGQIQMPKEWNAPTNLVRRITNSDAFEKYMIENFDVKTDHVLAFSRAKVAHYNNLIRKKLFGNTNQMFMPGEVLVFDSFCQLVSDDGVQKSFHTSDQIELDAANVVTKVHNAFKQSFKVYELKFHEGKKFTVCIIHDDDIKRYNQCCLAAKKALQQLAEKEKRQITTVEWQIYYQHTEQFKCPLIYSYAQTCHKSQGSTYECVYVDAINIRCCAKDDPMTMRRCTYTAVTRASEQLTLLI